MHTPGTQNSNQARTIYSVSELNRTIRDLLESQFPLLWIEGEISNLAKPASGHLYFTLKDERAQVRCAMFKSRNLLVRFKPENGQKVLIRARVGLYEARGEFQLVAEHMEEAGDGALQRAFDELKARLAAEGLFDSDRKREIPQLPQHIGIISSATGAAVRDVLSVLKRRFPSIPVSLYPVAVQGDKAVPEITRALALAQMQQRCDVLLLVRGGGSLEDLWAFNEEAVARAIVDCTIPIVCGVGHEVDITIADFAADQRAPTPSAAAELVSPDQQTWLHRFNTYRRNLIRLMQQQLKQTSSQSQWLQSRLRMQHPRTQLAQQAQQLDDLSENLQAAFFNLLDNKKHQLKYATQGLLNNRPDQFIDYQKIQLDDLTSRLRYISEQRLESRQQQLANLCRTLQAVSPLNTLSRGYSITQTADGKTITDSNQVQSGEQIISRLHHGEIKSRVE